MNTHIFFDIFHLYTTFIKFQRYNYSKDKMYRNNKLGLGFLAVMIRGSTLTL